VSRTKLLRAGCLGVAALLLLAGPVFAQEQLAEAAAATAAQAPEPLNEDELEVLVARIALYPDELVAVISGASLYPLQVVEAARYLEKYEKDKSLKPKASWDGSVISLLNYPEVVTMMSDDLEWTQSLGDALTYQQKDVLIAIQQLREEAVANGVIKSDDKVKVVTENDNIVIQPATTGSIYVPRYEPEMLYEPGYAIQPISYYPDPYPNYYYPTATFFAAAVTGAVWAGAVDWDDWGVWGGRWNGGDVDIDCNDCFNNINGKINFNDVDWQNVDRSKIKIDKDQFAKFDRTNMKNKIEANTNNNFRNKATEIRNNNPSGMANGKGKFKDVRTSTLDGLKAKPGDLGTMDAGSLATRKPGDPAGRRPDTKNPTARSDAPKLANKGNISKSNADIKKPANLNRPAGKPKPAARIDNRPSKPSGLGNIDRGKVSRVQSNRGRQAMGGGNRGGGGHKAVHRGGGGRGR
jgi:Protein of unknown function (DUF3300)